MDGVFGFLFFAVFVIIIVISIKNQVTGKSISKCPNCGRGVTKNLFNCPKCGAELKKKCSNCGQWLAINALSCYACHAKCNDMPINNISNNIRKYTQSTNSAKTTNTYNSSTNNSYKNTPRNDNKVCTYHDTYSSGNNCDYHDNKYIPPSYSNLDDIGLVKGKKKNKVETVEEYERSRHRSGAYSVNVNEVQSYDRKNSYSTHSDPVFRQNNTTNRRSSKSNKSCFIVALFIIIFMVLPMVLPFACMSISECQAQKYFNWDDFDEEYSSGLSYEDNYDDSNSKRYAYMRENININNIKNMVTTTLINNVKNEETLNSNDSLLLISHFDEDKNKYQILLLRTSSSDTLYENFFYYNVNNKTFVLDQFLDESGVSVNNSYVYEDSIRFIQVDYYEYDCEDVEDIDVMNIMDNDITTPNEKYVQECEYDINPSSDIKLSDIITE
ncbi:MAG: zinc ribbon domain-containing protein [Acutalibacteraceae bacterium]